MSGELRGAASECTGTILAVALMLRKDFATPEQAADLLDEAAGKLGAEVTADVDRELGAR